MKKVIALNYACYDIFLNLQVHEANEDTSMIGDLFLFAKKCFQVVHLISFLIDRFFLLNEIWNFFIVQTFLFWVFQQA